MSSLRSIRVSVTRHFLGTPFWGTFRKGWNETGSTLRKAWIVLWAVGVVLLALGAWGDSNGFWADKPYLASMFSALTSAAFGVPLALVVLQRIAASEADAAEARAARRMAGRVSADLASAVAALVKGGIPAMKTTKIHLRDQQGSLVPNGDYWRPATAPRLYYEPFVDAIESAMQRIEILFSPEMKRCLAEVSTQWSILTLEARSGLLSTGNKWLTGVQVEELEALVTTVTGPALEDWRKKGRALQNWYREEDRQAGDMNQYYGEMETLREFDSWFSEIINFIDAIINLTTKSAYIELTLASR
jgi:hypothetical protein